MHAAAATPEKLAWTGGMLKVNTAAKPQSSPWLSFWALASNSAMVLEIDSASVASCCCLARSASCAITSVIHAQYTHGFLLMRRTPLHTAALHVWSCEVHVYERLPLHDQ